MTESHTWRVIGVALWLATLLLLAFLFRYEIVMAGGDYGRAYRLNRWTGDVVFFQGAQYSPTRPVEPPPDSGSLGTFLSVTLIGAIIGALLGALVAVRRGKPAPAVDKVPAANKAPAARSFLDPQKNLAAAKDYLKWLLLLVLAFAIVVLVILVLGWFNKWW